MATQREPLTGADRYGLAIPLDFLNGAAIASAVWMAMDLDISDENIDVNVVSALFELSAGASYGNKKATVEIITDDVPARSKCYEMFINAGACQG